MISTSDYLARIGISGKPKPTLDWLGKLQLAHLLNVPFENYDIHDHIEIVCDEERFVDKIVRRSRGGFCYELNGAFSWLLRELGFRVDRLSARVGRESGGYGPEFDHMTLMVHLDEDYIVDVGFGNFSRAPLPLSGGEREDVLGKTKISPADKGSYTFSRLEDDKWIAEYIFSLTTHELPDYAPMCYYHQTSPESPFPKKTIATIYTDTGRVSISNNTLTETVKGEKKVTELTKQETKRLLKETFGIKI
jgi:N-hydroxyarylamine O-acetyltransferase